MFKTTEYKRYTELKDKDEEYSLFIKQIAADIPVVHTEYEEFLKKYNPNTKRKKKVVYLKLFDGSNTDINIKKFIFFTLAMMKY